MGSEAPFVRPHSLLQYNTAAHQYIYKHLYIISISSFHGKAKWVLVMVMVIARAKCWVLLNTRIICIDLCPLLQTLYLRCKTKSMFYWQCVSIACYAERCLSHDRFCLTVRPTVRHTLVSCQNDSSYDHAVLTEDSPMTLVSWRLTSAGNSKGNIGSEGTEWERGSKNVAKIGNF